MMPFESDHSQSLPAISTGNVVATDSTLAGNGKEVCNAFVVSPTLEERMQRFKMKLAQFRHKLNEQGQNRIELDENYSKDILVFAKNSIITVACRVVLFHFGTQPQTPSKSNRVQNSLNADEQKTKMKQFLNLSNSKASIQQFAKEADRILALETTKLVILNPLKN